jgi:hypothetical protein
MALSHELSSEIASAMLAVKTKSPEELEELKQTILLVHATLQRLTDNARPERLKSQPASKQAGCGN